MGRPIAPSPMNPTFIDLDAHAPGRYVRLLCRGMADPLLFVTQVAPYDDGPAGVHGVLDQAAVGVQQVAEMHGLRGRRVDDVRDVSRRRSRSGARRSPCSRSARRRGAPSSAR